MGHYHKNQPAARPGKNPHPVSLDAEGERHEFEQLLEAILEQRGLDFRNYSHSSLKRRVLTRVMDEDVHTIGALQKRVLANRAAMDRLLTALTIHVTAMFRDPNFYIAFRRDVLPVLRTYPFIRFWVAGCSTGEEVYSLAILLHEAGLYSRSRIYATDLQQSVLERARQGIFPLATMRDYTRNYQQAGGENAFAEYYTSDHELVIFRSFLRENLIFATHNLAGDASFNEFQVIFCRNVMIYFNRSLQDRVHGLFYESLVTYGYLVLGRSESMRFSRDEKLYEAISAKERIYRKIK